MVSSSTINPGSSTLMRTLVTVHEADFNIAELQEWLLSGEGDEGAIATFTGYVRADKNDGDILYMELEQYPGMAQSSVETIIAQAGERWLLQAVRVVHRVGRLYPCDQIVWVGVSSAHRADAFSACEYIMDYLKAEAPLWKKVFNNLGAYWVEAKPSDSSRAGRWSSEHAK